MRASVEMRGSAEQRGAVILQFPSRRRRSPRLERWLVAALVVALAAVLAGAARRVDDREATGFFETNLMPD